MSRNECDKIQDTTASIQFKCQRKSIEMLQCVTFTETCYEVLAKILKHLSQLFLGKITGISHVG